MKHLLMMVIGCVLPLLLIFLLPAFGVSNNMSFVVFIVLMFACHLMHFGMHRHEDKPNHKHEHKH